MHPQPLSKTVVMSNEEFKRTMMSCCFFPTIQQLHEYIFFLVVECLSSRMGAHFFITILTHYSLCFCVTINQLINLMMSCYIFAIIQQLHKYIFFLVVECLSSQMGAHFFNTILTHYSLCFCVNINQLIICIILPSPLA